MLGSLGIKRNEKEGFSWGWVYPSLFKWWIGKLWVELTYNYNSEKPYSIGNGFSHIGNFAGVKGVRKGSNYR